MLAYFPLEQGALGRSHFPSPSLPVFETGSPSITGPGGS